ncbi:MAG TPA: dihydrodipicolinate reductase C-terminal domain-containing protein [Pyrinomonadaceae bacterium]|nr:dihydrodipicolinate reductase C-terminal domain-containing protein [Pyrinomonadaceae bacterium]
MRIALIGHGAMGRLVESRALEEGHKVTLVLTSSDMLQRVDEVAERIKQSADVAIDFSVADAVLNNISACMTAGVPLVEGTTGWNRGGLNIERFVEQQNGALLHGANFSIGVNLFYRVVERAGELFMGLDEYAPFIEEAHHARKKDAPSGTALRLKELLSSRLKREIPVSSTRAGFIPGTHRIGFDGIADQITLTHTARSREGFAAGALLAARWIIGRTGVYEFSEAFDDILKERMMRKWL